MAAERDRSLRPWVPLALEEGLAAFAMVIICAISLANVVVRYATDASFAFTEEFSVFLLVFMALFGAAVAFARDEHIRIGFFQQRLPGRLRWAATVVTFLATLAVFALIIRYGAAFAYQEWRWESTSPGLGLPNWIYSVWLPLGAVVIISRVLGRFVRQLRQGTPD
ncbi:TRAP transporter small permease [Arhodomonas sp. AD133]|uniref:TRAP transporter small permease n=1 Tax=Arhodomonas sp. AD133 TaxID=3415009 RepID=UPI003EBC70BD